MNDPSQQGYRPTVLDSGEVPSQAIPATVLDTGNGTVLEGGTAIPATDAPLPDESFDGFVAERRLHSQSTEAEILLVQHPETGERRVVKWYYQIDHQPATNVLDSLRSMSVKHIPILHGYGKSRGGRFFELLEYIEEGSLGAWMDAAVITEDECREIVREIVIALEHLSEHGITHRDLKPENILVRSRSPLDLVLVDFGIARRNEGHLHKTKLGETPLYSPPGGGKFVQKNSDWWSLGIIIVKLRAGQHPWEELDNDTIIYNKNVFPAPIPEEMGEDWVLLAKGLLTRDPDKRWAADELKRWLNGERDIPVYFDSRVLVANDTGPAITDYERGIRMNSFADVAELLAGPEFDANERFLSRNGFSICDWMRNIGRTEEADQLESLLQDDVLAACEKVAAALFLFDADDKLKTRSKGLLYLRGQMLAEEHACLLFSNPEQFHLDPDVVLKLIESGGMERWQQKLTGSDWLRRLRQQRESAFAFATEQGVQAQLMPDAANVLSVSPPASVFEEAARIRSNYVFSTSPAINRLLAKSGDLDFQEAWLLASVEPGLYMKAGEHAVHEFNSRFRALSRLVEARRAKALSRLLPVREPGHFIFLCSFIILAWICAESFNPGFSDFTIPLYVAWLAFGAVFFWMTFMLMRWAKSYALGDRGTVGIPSDEQQWSLHLLLRNRECIAVFPEFQDRQVDPSEELKKLRLIASSKEMGSATGPKVATPGIRGALAIPLVLISQIFLIVGIFMGPFILPAKQALPVLAGLGPGTLTKPNHDEQDNTPQLKNERPSPMREAPRSPDPARNMVSNERYAPEATSPRPVNSVPNTYPGERFPQTRMRELRQEEVSQMSMRDVQFAINEMYARHGAWFGKEEVRKDFEKFIWYRPRQDLSFNEIGSRFSTIEAANLKSLSAHRSRLQSGGEARQPSQQTRSKPAPPRPAPNPRPGGASRDRFDNIDRY